MKTKTGRSKQKMGASPRGGLVYYFILREVVAFRISRLVR